MGKNLYAVDQQPAVKWKFATEGPVISSPALAGRIVYFGSYDGKLYARDAATGQLKWKFKTAGERRYADRHLHGLLPGAETMPDPGIIFFLLPRCGTVPCISEAAMVTCTPWTPCREPEMEAQDRRRRAPFARNFQRHALHRQPGYVFVCAGRCHCKELWRFKTGEDAEIHNRVGMQSSSRRGRWRDSNVCAVGAKTGKQKWFT